MGLGDLWDFHSSDIYQIGKKISYFLITIYLINVFYTCRFGRKWALICALLGTTLMSLIRSASPSYVFFVIFEFLEALFSASIYGTCFIIGNYKIFNNSL
jgi:MFS family permease